MFDSTSLSIALLAMRLLLGILFFFQGYDRLFRLKTKVVLNAFSDVLAQRNIPLPFARACIFLSSAVELGCGFLLVTGLLREPALYLLTADLVCVALAFSLLKPMWDMSFFFPRFVLLIGLLIIPAEWDCYLMSNLF